jgi:hypothetical protein
MAKLKHRCGVQAGNDREAAPVLEFYISMLANKIPFVLSLSKHAQAELFDERGPFNPSTSSGRTGNISSR